MSGYTVTLALTSIARRSQQKPHDSHISHGDPLAVVTMSTPAIHSSATALHPSQSPAMNHGWSHTDRPLPPCPGRLSPHHKNRLQHCISYRFFFKSTQFDGHPDNSLAFRHKWGRTEHSTIPLNEFLFLVIEVWFLVILSLLLAPI